MKVMASAARAIGRRRGSLHEGRGCTTLRKVQAGRARGAPPAGAGAPRGGVTSGPRCSPGSRRVMTGRSATIGSVQQDVRGSAVLRSLRPRDQADQLTIKYDLGDRSNPDDRAGPRTPSKAPISAGDPRPERLPPGRQGCPPATGHNRPNRIGRVCQAFSRCRVLVISFRDATRGCSRAFPTSAPPRTGRQIGRRTAAGPGPCRARADPEPADGHGCPPLVPPVRLRRRACARAGRRSPATGPPPGRFRPCAASCARGSRGRGRCSAGRRRSSRRSP